MTLRTERRQTGPPNRAPMRGSKDPGVDSPGHSPIGSSRSNSIARSITALREFTPSLR